MATLTVEQQVQQVYIGLLGRAADKPGLDYWVDEIETGKLSIEQLRANIVNEQPEYATGLGTLTRPQVVAQLYQNMFERAPEASGLDYWVNGGGASVNIDQLVLALADGAGASDRLVLDNKVEAGTYYTVQAGEDFTRDAARAAVADVDSSRESVEDSKASTDSNTQSSGDTFTLTTSVDDVTGTANNDTFKGVLDSGTPANNTLTALDSIDGGAGIDTLSVLDAVGGDTVPASLVLTSIETVNVRSAGAITIDTSGAGFSSVNDVNVTQALGATAVTASSTQDVAVSGVAGSIDVAGGEDVTVTDATAGNDITIGETASGGTNANATGTISVTDTDQGAAAIAVDGGTDVTVAATSDVATGTIKVGVNTPASGAVSVTQNLNSEGDVLDNSAGDISVTGGTTVDVTVNGTITADAEADDAHALTSGDVVVTGDGNTTAVNVTQNLTATDYEKAAIDDVLPTQVLTFKALAANESTTVGGLTFTASKALTAEEVAAAFSGLTASDTQDAGGKVANGTYTGSLTANFTSGAASGAAVTFTGATAAVTAMTVTNGDIDPTSSFTAGTDNSGTAESADVSVVYGNVTVSDDAAAAITNIDLDGFADGILDGSSLDALQTLSLANSAGTTTVQTTQTALALNLDGITGTVDLDDATTAKNVTDLTVTASGAMSDLTLTADVLQNLTVNAAVDLDFDNAANYATASLQTVDVNGSGAVNLGDLTASVALNSFDASGNTGGVAATVEGDGATLTGSLTDYVLSAGNDIVTVNATTGSSVDVKVSAGAGDDSVTLGSGITAAGEVISGGAGTDTLVMDAADAETASGTTTFETSIDGFEKLSLGAVAAATTETVDLANMDDIDYVVSAGGGSAVTAVAEVQTLEFAGSTITDGDITVGGITVSVLAADTAAQTAAKVQTAINNQTLTAPASTGNVTASVAGSVVTVTFPTTAGDVADITLADGTGSITGTVVAEDTKGVAAAFGVLTLDNMANNGTIEVTEDGAATVNVTDAATGTVDVLNVVVTNDATVTSTVIANDVETINVTANDTFVDSSTPKDGKDDVDAVHDLTLDADSVTSVVVTGDDLVLDTNSSVLTSVDASALTGGLEYTADGAAAGTTVTGGVGSDTLDASGSNDVLNGGAGNDTLKGDNLTQLSGGAGDDTFVMNQPSNVNSYSTITDLGAGDVIKFDFATTGAAGDVEFSSAALDLADTAVFQDFANEAVNQLGTDVDDAAWFQFGGNTFIVQSGGNHDGTAGNPADFQAGQDSIIQIAGLVDLSTASYNQTDGTLEIA